MSPIKWAAKAMTANSPTLETGPRRLPVATVSTFGAKGGPGGQEGLKYLWSKGAPEVRKARGRGRRGARVPYTWEEPLYS